MSFRIAPLGVNAACALVVGAAAADSYAQAASPSQPQPLPPVIITGNPLGSSEITSPASSLAGDELVRRRGSTLGETLDGMPGVSSSYFGPNAGRPVIRGQDGDRIRVLNNAGSSLDASSVSSDHAVPIDPLAVERIEVLRGPAALLYGGSAVGGVVNTIDNRVPKSRIDGVDGTAEVRLGGPAHERGAGAVIETGAGGLAVHADGFWRKTDDLRVPRFDRPVDGGSERRDRVVNSASRAEGGAVGGSWVGDRGHLGAAFDTYRNDYGTVAEEDVTIGMRRDKLQLAGEARDIGGPIRTVRGQVQFADYEHREFEGNEIGTTFRNRGADTRFEFEHASVGSPLGPIRGVFGLQTERSRFRALGEEAFVPSTRTTQAAAFVYEEIELRRGKVNAGARLERTRVRSAGDPPGAEPQFGAAQSRRFDAASAAVGGLLDISEHWQASANLAYTERAPTFYELHANGVHVATATFERGDADLGKEKGVNLDVALQWKDGDNHVRAGAFAGRYSNYIALVPTGEADFVNDEGESFPVHEFRGVPARLWGMEVDGRWRIPAAGHRFDFDGKLDLVRVVDRDTGDPMPRIPPRRITLGVDWSQGAWKARTEVVHAARQARVPDDDVSTGSYAIVNVSVSRTLELPGAEGLVFARLNNLGDELAYNAATAASVRRLSPLPGRGLMVGLRVGF
jgi:iron complex outermembrane receptor protein